MQIVNGNVFIDGKKFCKKTIEITKERITGLTEKQDITHGNPVIDAMGCYVVPGFLDIHFHGCMGQDFSDASLKGLQNMATYQLQNGITSICPTTMTLPEENLQAILRCTKLFCRTVSDKKMANLLGINMEGPFLSTDKKGAQNSNYIIAPDIPMFQRLLDASEGLLKLTTIAPETPGAMEFIKAFHNKVSISLGHTVTDYETAWRAFQYGANHVTHLFNAMPGFHHRDSGLIGAAFDIAQKKPLYVELICDGIHLSDPVIRSTFTLFSHEQIVLVSDSMRATGMSDGTYTLGQQEVQVQGNSATLQDGTLAGSVSNLYQCFRHIIDAGIPLENALKTVTINPAKSIGVDADYGSISPGKMADLLILNSDFSIRDIIFHGTQVPLPPFPHKPEMVQRDSIGFSSSHFEYKQPNFPDYRQLLHSPLQSVQMNHI